MKINISDLSIHLNVDYDLFICSASYEERCVAISKALPKDKINAVLISVNEDYLNYINNNVSKLSAIWQGKSEIIEVSSENPLNTADAYKNILSSYSEACNILIDITAFTHESLLILLKLISEVYSGKQLDVDLIYNSASEYCPGMDIDDKWLSKGVKSLHSVLGYAGNLMPNCKDNLIIVVGYEFERAVKIVEIIEPEKLTLVYGETNSQMPKNKEANKKVMRLIQEMSVSYNITEPITIPCDDPQRTCDIILDEAICDGMNNIIVPMNNKITTFGIALAAMT